jgi:hypothetical protein
VPDRKKLVRRKYDGFIFEAIKYGNLDGSWSPECATRVATFLLGMDPDKMTTVANERMLDVVKPILSQFDPINGVAPITVFDTVAKRHFTIQLGDWILRREGQPFLFVKPSAMTFDFEDLPEDVENDLANFIYDECMSTLDGELYQALAEGIAARLIRAGWSKKEER